MTTSASELQQKQLEQAEELLFSGPQRTGFAKELYFGRFRADSILPYPSLAEAEQTRGDDAVAAVRKFCDEQIDPERVDREADIPREVIHGLGDVGVLGMTVSPEHGGRGLSQQNYCRVMEVIGGHCAATAVFVNAHHSIGLRALELFGTKEQQQRWMGPLVTGEQIAAFALTEKEAGSDASNVQTRAEPTADGSGFVLNGTKQYITNAAIAQVLTVMARTPDEKEPDGKITAFLVTPDMPGFEVVEARMEKCGIRGTATGRLAFNDMIVPCENVLGEIGKGLRLALTVLDFGRTTFGASCTGAAKFCIDRAVERANTRRQFGRSLGEFELVKQKIAHAAADTFAMECATYHTAALIDSGAEDYMLETAMLKVFASDALWRIVNDTLQIWGGAGYFSDEPFERMMRDARINLIGEGANDVLRSFIAMVGLRNVGKELESVQKKPWSASKLWRSTPRVPVVSSTKTRLSTHAQLQSAARLLGGQIGKFGRVCRNSLIRHREGILEMQCVQARLADVATELFAASCVFARLNSLATATNVDEQTTARDMQTGLFYIKAAHRRNALRMASLKSNDDGEQLRTADLWLG
ncbi:MAG: acyl-CoA dehydrogenase [Planctomycetaceae bacterium]|jgi:acyl-CoA dehydrogenase family member 9|nr:acyl-CoA dehydrogenase [Planctomycetaceae bacterium]MBT6157291.1 acyl-CoA dehydrogenase [Planctomycetaceae bacterium]MBT6487703.1 acyl-CoA dehydrogenase [Planctomycetaceae bacterium]MBT6494821.1 acyl-CoA dehydrogenase [Planctomycetaceae bacterium]